jgi:hypothetical protein
METIMKVENEMQVRFDLEMSQRTEGLLNRLAARHASTPSQIMSNALALFDVVTSVAVDGRRLLVTDNEYVPIGEIVGLIKSQQVAVLPFTADAGTKHSATAS